MIMVSGFQTKILRKPVIGLLHALVFWGFMVILIGSIEMIIDGITGHEKIFAFLGPFYDFFMASGDIFAYIIVIAISVFLVRRLSGNIKRFNGPELSHKNHFDAIISLSLILFLMVSLAAMNIYYLASPQEVYHGVYPISALIAPLFQGMHSSYIMYEICWWSHILLVLIFANILPYSKHFHVFLSVPNTFLSRIEPLGKLTTMDSITKEVKSMMNPETAYATPAEDVVIERFGVKDIEDVTWKNYFDSLSCTQCGRCTSVCPANITGKKLSPRKVMMDIRSRMNEKGPGLVKNGKEFSDNKSLVRDYISPEELWACTTCNACAKECPINISQPTLIVDMRRYLVMEESSAPSGINAIFNNIQNNGAPWQFSPQDRLIWTQEKGGVEVPVMANVFAQGKKPEYLFWVGCAGAFDDRYKKVSRAFAKILNALNIDYAVLGTEETCTGDPARRAGNEMLFQMQALMNIETFKIYEVKKIITICPHCFNTFKNEYPDLGGNYEVVHYTTLLKEAIETGKIKLNDSPFTGKKITYHDPCYLGRANNDYKNPRNIIHSVNAELVEMERNKSFALCCGAGGGQMFKEAEKGNKEIFIERTEEALETKAEIIASACPFCMVMLTDGLKYKNKEEEIYNYDLAELIAIAMKL